MYLFASFAASYVPVGPVVITIPTILEELHWCMLHEDKSNPEDLVEKPTMGRLQWVPKYHRNSYL